MPVKKSVFTFDYSTRSDILNIHKRDVLVKGSAELGDFTLDFDTTGSVVGVEIMNVSEFLEQLHIAKQELSTIERAEIIQVTKNQLTIIWLKIKFMKRADPTMIALPTPIEERKGVVT